MNLRTGNDLLHQASGVRASGFVLPFALLLCGCASVETATDKAARDAAKTMMPEALAVYFPQVPKELFTPFTDCVVDNANGAEVRILAEDALVGVDAGTADTIRGILERPETQDCLSTATGGPAVRVAPS